MDKEQAFLAKEFFLESIGEVILLDSFCVSGQAVIFLL